jgi:hypothetical protein
VKGFVADAKARMEKGDFEGARTSISNAFELDPSNAEVNSLRNAIDAKLGGRAGSVADVASQQADRDRVRRTEARLEVENKLIESKRLKESGDVSGAIRALQDAELILRWNPYLGGTTESGTTEANLREQIAQLQGEKASAERNVAAEREKRAAEEKRERETEERQKTQNPVQRFLQQANDAFHAENNARRRPSATKRSSSSRRTRTPRSCATSRSRPSTKPSSTASGPTSRTIARSSTRSTR